MPMDLSETAAVLSGICEVAEAETLLAWLQAHPQGPVDVSGCEHAHTALVQVLIAARPALTGGTGGLGGADAPAWVEALRLLGKAV